MKRQKPIRPEINDALAHLQRTYKVSKARAEEIFLSGFAEIAKLAGEPIPRNKLTLECVSSLIGSGGLAKLEDKARAKATRLVRAQDESRTGGSFERARPKNPFV